MNPSRTHQVSLLFSLCAATAATLALGGCQEYAPGRDEPTEYVERDTHPEPSPAVRILRTQLQALPAEPAAITPKVVLGRRLFHDRALSRDGTLSCASCHDLERGGTDQRATSLGIAGQVGPINSPTVLNARYNFVQFWDGRAADLRAQAAGPVANPREMGNDWNNVVTTLQRTPGYVTEFAAVYPAGITEANVRDAIAAYEEVLVTPSRVDRFLRGDDAALTADERAGAELFVTVGCVTCHNGINLGGASYQKFGVVRQYLSERALTEVDNGRFNVSHDENDRFIFKVPTLRNVALTAPYFHDASAPTLERAVEVMGRYQLGRDLTPGDITRLVAFLRATTGELPAGARMPQGS